MQVKHKLFIDFEFIEILSCKKSYHEGENKDGWGWRKEVDGGVRERWRGQDGFGT